LPRHERDRILRRIEELQQMLRHTRTDDVRVALEQALDDCRQRLRELEELLGERGHEVAGRHERRERRNASGAREPATRARGR
jgi:hypothetical protein